MKTALSSSHITCLGDHNARRLIRWQRNIDRFNNRQQDKAISLNEDQLSTLEVKRAGLIATKQPKRN